MASTSTPDPNSFSAHNSASRLDCYNSGIYTIIFSNQYGTNIVYEHISCTTADQTQFFLSVDQKCFHAFVWVKLHHCIQSRSDHYKASSW